MPIKHFIFLDIDGCSTVYLTPEEIKQLKTSQTAQTDLSTFIQAKRPNLIAYIRQLIASTKAETTHVASGSNRQAFDLDVENSREQTHKGRLETPSSFHTLTAYAEILEASYHAVILTDIFANQSTNEPTAKQVLTNLGNRLFYNEEEIKLANAIAHNLQTAVEASPSRLKTCPTVTVDQYKIVMFFVHLQYLAQLHPNDEIVVDFFDDRNVILENLASFYSKNLGCLPKNITFKTYTYVGYDEDPEPTLHSELKGTGEAVTNFQKIAVDYLALLDEKIDHFKQVTFDSIFSCEDFAKFISGYHDQAIKTFFYTQGLIDDYTDHIQSLKAITSQTTGSFFASLTQIISKHLETTLLNSLKENPFPTEKNLLIHCQTLASYLENQIQASKNLEMNKALSPLYLQAKRLELHLKTKDGTYTDTDINNIKTRLITFLDDTQKYTEQHQTEGCQLIKAEFTNSHYSPDKPLSKLFDLYAAILDIAYTRLQNLNFLHTTTPFYTSIIDYQFVLFNNVKPTNTAEKTPLLYGMTDTPVFRS